MGVSTAIEAVKAGWASMAGRAADGKGPAHLVVPDGDGPFGGVIVAMEAFGLNGHMKSVAERIARQGYVVAAPDLYYRAVGERVVGYDQLPRTIELMMERAGGMKFVFVMTPELSDVAPTGLGATRRPESTAVDATHVFCGRDGWCHLTAIIDCWDRNIVGWRLSKTGVAKIAAATLEDALRSRKIDPAANELTPRSDFGLVFGAKPFVKVVRRYELDQGYITPYTPEQNGMIERFFGR